MKIFYINPGEKDINQCKIKMIKPKDARKFFNENCLYGYVNSSINIGVIYEEQIISLMSFCKTRFNKKYEWELTRLCQAMDCNVISAYQKQFQYFIDKFKPKSVLTYVDRRYNDGKIQKELGFELTRIIKPTELVQLKGTTSLIPLKFLSKKYLKKYLKGYNSSISLQANLSLNQCYIVYDCGKFLFTKKFV